MAAKPAADSALGHIVESHLLPRDPDLFVQQRGHAAGAVLLGVFLTADAEDAAVEQAGRDGLHAAPIRAGTPQIGADLLAQAR